MSFVQVKVSAWSSISGDSRSKHEQLHGRMVTIVGMWVVFPAEDPMQQHICRSNFIWKRKRGGKIALGCNEAVSVYCVWWSRNKVQQCCLCVRFH